MKHQTSILARRTSIILATVIALAGCAARPTAGLHSPAPSVPDVPEWARRLYPDTGLAAPTRAGGPIFRSVEVLGRWQTGSRELQAVWVDRVIPEMDAPRGLQAFILRDDATDQILFVTRHISKSDIVCDPSGLIIIGNGPPISLSENHLNDLGDMHYQMSAMIADTAVPVVSAVLRAYIDGGAIRLRTSLMPDLLAAAEPTYWREGLPAEMVQIPSRAALLPEQPSCVRVFQVFAQDLREGNLKRSKMWEALVYAEAVDASGAVTSMMFAVYGSHCDSDLVSRVLITDIGRGRGGSNRSIIWEYCSTPVARNETCAPSHDGGK